MTRAVKWAAEQAVERQSAQTVWRDLGPALAASSDPTLLKVLASLELRAELLSICVDHLAWREQEEAALTTAQGNDQLRRLRDKATAYVAGAASSRPDLHALQILIAGLGSDPELALRLRLRNIGLNVAAYSDLDAASEDWKALAEAAHLAINTRPGPSRDYSLRFTLGRLIDLYVKASGNTFTHSAASDYCYDGRPHSAGGRFIVEVMSGLEPDLHGTELAGLLASLKREAPPSPRAAGRKRKPPKAS